MLCQVEDGDALGDLLDEATRAEYDPHEDDEGSEADDVFIDMSDPKPAPPPVEIPASQFSPGRSDVQPTHVHHLHAGSLVIPRELDVVFSAGTVVAILADST